MHNFSPDETQFDRGAWVFFSLILFVIFGQLALTLAGFQQPADGWNTRNNTANNQVSLYFQISDQPSPLQVNDIVLALNGQPLLVQGAYPKLEEVKVGQIVRYTIQRDGQIMDVDVQLIQRSWRDICRFWQRTEPFGLLTSLLTLLVFGFAFFKRPGSTPARILFLLGSTLFGGSWFGFADFTFWNNYYPVSLFFWIVLGGSAWSWLFFPAFTHLTLTFPVKMGIMQRYPRLFILVLYGLPVLFSLPYILTLLIKRDSSALNTWAATLFGMMTVFVISFIYSTIHNWRTQHTPTVRAQLRWVALGIAGWVVTVILFAIASYSRDEGPRNLINILSNLLTLSLPICLAIAITRYRLFDIDIIIRRTVQYSILTGLLGLIYFGGVVLFQGIFRTASGETSSLAIVLSTLIIAALFAPLRRRVQNVIDRRFFRQKYDAAAVLARFAMVARDEVEMEKLAAAVVNVIETTVQPEQVSVWLKPFDNPRRNSHAK